MKRFLFSYDIESASGTQCFYVDAETLEEAKVKIEDGGDIYSDECEVTGLCHDPEFVGETSIDDFGDFPPEAHNLEARVAELEAQNRHDGAAEDPRDCCREALEKIVRDYETGMVGQGYDFIGHAYKALNRRCPNPHVK